jgi:hypothetical protein
MDTLKNNIDNLLELPYYYYIVLCLAVIIILDIISAFRFYYLNLYYGKILEAAESKRLKYLRDTLISGYQTMASEKSLESALEKIRKAENEMDELPFDFSEYYEQYKKDIKNVHKRGYL